MASGSNDLEALVKVSTEIGETETKLNFANQCIKAQEDLTNKLKKEIQRRREIWNYMKSDNLKLETEIRNAEIETQSLMFAHETIKSANIELKKELLLGKENYTEVVERVKNGEKKYEDLWLQCKSRYENLPFVKNLMEAKQRSDFLQDTITGLDFESKMLYTEVKTKKLEFVEKDRKQIIQLAEFLINEMPASFKIIKEKHAQINELQKEIDELLKEQESHKVPLVNNSQEDIKTRSFEEKRNVKLVDENWPTLSKTLCNDNSLMMPILQLPNVDCDKVRTKLDLKKVTLQATQLKKTVTTTDQEKCSTSNTTQTDDQNLNDNYISCYFNKPMEKLDTEEKTKKPESYSGRKLINILEDLKVDGSEAFNLVSRVNPDHLQGVTEIGLETSNGKNTPLYDNDKEASLMEAEEMETLDLTAKSLNDILYPPSPFLDSSQESGVYKKRVSFDLPMIVEEVSNEVVADDKPADDCYVATISSQMDSNSVNDESYMRIKDIILKKHHMDLSPQFIYSKNTAMQKKLDENIVTSKFFDQNSVIEPDDENQENCAKAVAIADNEVEITTELKDNKTNKKETLTNSQVFSTSNERNNDMERPVIGLLYTHGPQGIPDSLDISMSTTGFEEGDSDFPNCLDTSLLLSPKADLQLPTNENNDISSQEVPNFLSGFRKTGLSFFKQKTSEPNAGSSTPSQENNYNFNFGRDDKKARGGLFSFFH